MSYDRRSEPRRSHSGGRANYGRHRGGRADQKSPDLRNQGSLDHRHRTYRNGTPEYGDRYRRRSPSGARQGREPRAYRYGRNGPYRRSRTRSPERKRSRSLEPYPRSERFTQRDAPSARFGSRASYLRSRGTCRGASRSPSRSGRRQSPILRGQDGRRDAGSPSSSRSRYRERREDYRERDRRQSPPDRQFYRSGRSPNRNERSAYRGRNTRQSFSPAKRGIEDRFGDRRQAERGQYRRKPSSEPREQRRSPRGRRSPERRQSSAFPRSVSRSFSGSTKRIAAAASGRTASAVHTPRGGSCSTAKDKKSPSGDAHSPGHPSSGRQWSYRDSGQKSDGASTRRSVELDRRSRRLSSSGSRGKADATPSRRSPLHTKAPVRSHGGSRERAENEGARRSQQREEELTRRSGEREDDRCRRSEQREDEGSRGEQRDDEHKERFAQLGDERGRGSLQREDSPSRGSMLRKNGPCRRSEQREDGHSRRSGQREDGHSRHSEQREDGPSRHSQQRENGRSRPSDQREKPRRVVSPRQSADCPTPDLTLTRSSGAEGERRRAADGDRKPSLASDECEPLSVEEGAQERHLSAESESRRESATGLAGIQEQSASSPDGKELSNIGAGAKARKCESSPPSPSVLRMEAEDKDHKERSPSRISTKAAPETALPKSAAGEVEEPTELAAVHSGRDLGSCSVSSAPFQHQGGTPRMEEDAVLTKSKRVHSSSLRSPETRRRTASLRGSPRPRGEDNPESDEIADARPDNNRSMSGARSSSSAPIRSVDPEGTIVRRRIVATGPERTPVGEEDMYRRVSPNARNMRALRRIPGRRDPLYYSISRVQPGVSNRWSHLENDERFDHRHCQYGSCTSRSVRLVETDNGAFAAPYPLSRNMTPMERLRGPFHQREFRRAVPPHITQSPLQGVRLPFERGRKQVGVLPGRGGSARKHVAGANNPDGKWNHDLYEQLTNEPERKRPRFNLYGETLEKVED